MKFPLVLAGLMAALASAEDSTSPLTFTYQTFLTGSKTVEFATTTYSLTATTSAATSPNASHSTSTDSSATTTSHASSTSAGKWPNPWQAASWPGFPWWYHQGGYPTPSVPPHPGPPFGFPSGAPAHPTASSSAVHTTSTSTSTAEPSRYTLNRADLAYPIFPNTTLPATPANATSYALEGLKLVSLLKNANSSNCALCKSVFSNLQITARENQNILEDISVPFCTTFASLLPYPICIGLFDVASNDLGGIIGSTGFDWAGDDGTTFCAFMFGVCPLPAPPPLDLETLFHGQTTKPPPRKIEPSNQEPLKVLHFSDYHLDERYVVGSEANCGGALCCRVFPYTNTSAPIKEPASLFGNYQCDTPEAMATSVFRNVPKVTGLNWEDFSFGIFTGDLVSHDLWELTEAYVLAEELISYQQFFDGMGSVKLFPTLGNHDTFPHAFTSFLYQNNLLPYNASYPVQELYNYENVSAAWSNYGWLDAETAQSVVTSGLGIYRTLTPEGLVIISLNSDVWYYFNLYAYLSVNTIDPTGMFATLINWLLEAERANQAVWLIQHVNVGGSTDFEALPAPTDLFYQIVDRFNNTIRATFFGHTHADEFGVFYTNNGTIQDAAHAAVPAYIMPSVTSYQNLNGGFRYYMVDPVSFDVIDSLTYYANVSNTLAWEQEGDVEWQFEYSARQTYDPTGTLLPSANYPLTAAFWHNVTEEIITNSTMYERYTDLRTKLFRPYTPDTAAEMKATKCGLRSLSVPIFEDCLGTHDSTTSFL